MKREERRVKLHKDNRGLTLVELIASIAILSIAVGSILSTFIYVSRFNARSKVKQRATVCAQTVMEYFKAYDIDDIHKAFASNSGFLVDNAATYSFVPETVVGGTPDPSSVNGTYIIKNMTMSDEASDKTVDAVVTVTEGYKKSVSQINVFDKAQDSLFQEFDETHGSYYYDSNFVATEIMQHYCDMHKVGTDAVKNIAIQKNIYIDLEDSGAKVSYVYTGTITYNNQVPNYNALGEIVSYSASDSYTYGDDPSENPRGAVIDTATSLRDVYFYYYPSYSLTGAAAAGVKININQDTLTVNNYCTNENINNVYVYKQADTSKNKYNLIVAEAGYTGLLVKSNVVGGSRATYVYDQIYGNLGYIIDGSAAGTSYSILHPSAGLEANCNVFCDKSNGSETNTAITSNVSIAVFLSTAADDGDKYVDGSNTEEAVVVLSGTVVN